MKSRTLTILFLFVLALGAVAFTSPPWMRAVDAAPVADNGNGNDNNDDHQGGILVDNDLVQCPNAAFTSIQAAVNAAGPGGLISVCPGSYPETVRIDKNLTVRGIRVGNEKLVVINPPIAAGNTTSLSSGNPIAAIVLVERASNVKLENITVDGSANLISGCTPNLMGIFYRNASGRIDDAAVRNIRLFPDSLLGCQSGFAIFAQSGNEVGVQRGARVDVNNTSVHDYQKNGITGNEDGTVLTASGNAVTGLGPTPAIAQNGVQVGFGARGRVVRNSIINHVYSQCTPSSCAFTSSNILIFDAASGVDISRNNVGKSQVNIFLFGSAAPITNGTIDDNTVFDSDVFNGIAIINGNNNKVRGNSVFNSDEASVFVQGDNNRITANTFNEAPIGVLVDAGSSGTHINGNKYFNIGQLVVPPSAASSSLRSSTTVRAGSPSRP